MSARPPIAGVVVLYRPAEEVGARLRRMKQAGLTVIAVFNECDPARLERLRGECGVQFVTFPENRGIAAALNAGIAEARRIGCDFVVLFDQDSEPRPNQQYELLEVLHEAERDGCQVAAVGPTPVDVKAEAAPHARQDRGRYERVQTLITSGSLLPMKAIDEIGPMWEALFIDDVDHEWCMRARWLGWDIIKANQIEMSHDLGDRGITVFGRFKPIHRSPMRHYHIVRNTLVMLRLRGVDVRWRISEGLKTLYRIPAYILASTNRRQTIGAIARAVRDHRGLLLSAPKQWSR